MMFVLLEFVPEPRSKSITAFFTGKFILTELIAVIEITVLGRIMELSDYPFFSAGAYSQPFSIQRADSLYMILFTMLCVMTVTLQIVLCSMLIKEIFPDLKYNTLLSTVLMLGASSAVNILNIDLTAVTGILILLLAVIVPIIMYTRRKLKHESKTSDSAVSASADA